MTAIAISILALNILALGLLFRQAHVLKRIRVDLVREARVLKRIRADLGSRMGAIVADQLKVHLNTSLWPQIQGLSALYRVMDSKETVPCLRSWAMSPDLLWTIISHVQRSNVSNIVECGSGASTIMLASALRAGGLSGHIWAIEDHQPSAQGVIDELKRRGLDNYATVCQAPLKVREYPGFSHKFSWYDLATVQLPSSIDLLIVDGPWGKTNADARYPAGPELLPKLSPDAHIFVDDTKRAAEGKLAELWQKLYPELDARQLATEKGAAEMFFRGRAT